MDIPLSDIRFANDDDGQLINPRGKITNTAGFQESLQIAGQRNPIEVFHAGDHYVVIDGHRRVIAARALGWKSICADVKEQPADNIDLLAQMLGSYVRADLTPLRWGQAIQRLSREKSWGIERVAKLCGLKVDVAQLYVDLTNAPEAVQRRVDAGEMSLTAFKTVRTKPRQVQEVAARLENPTVSAVKQAAKQDKSKGDIATMLDAMGAEHKLITSLNEIRAQVISEWHTLTSGEQARAQFLIESICEFTGGMYASIEDSGEPGARLRTA